MEPRQGIPQGSTLSAEEEQRGVYLGMDPVVVLWVPSLGIEIGLPSALRFTVGRHGVEVGLPHLSVSRHHANVERRGNALRWIDAGSKLRSGWGEVRTDDTIMRPGEALEIGRLYVVGLSRSMVEALRSLLFLLGYSSSAEIVTLVTDVARGRSCVVLGPDDAGRVDVARALLGVSPRLASRRELGEGGAAPVGAAGVRAWADDAAGGTVYLDGAALAAMATTDRRLLLGLVTSEARQICAAVTCDSVEHARDLLGDDQVPAWRFVQVPLVASRARRGELPAMVDHLLAAYGSSHRVASIGPRISIQPIRLERYPWRYEFNELRACVVCLIAELEDVPVRHLADRFKVDHNSLRRVMLRWQSGDEGKRPTDDVIRALVRR